MALLRASRTILLALLLAVVLAGAAVAAPPAQQVPQPKQQRAPPAKPPQQALAAGGTPGARAPAPGKPISAKQQPAANQRQAAPSAKQQQQPGARPAATNARPGAANARPAAANARPAAANARPAAANARPAANTARLAANAQNATAAAAAARPTANVRNARPGAANAANTRPAANAQNAKPAAANAANTRPAANAQNAKPAAANAANTRPAANAQNAKPAAANAKPQGVESGKQAGLSPSPAPASPSPSPAPASPAPASPAPASPSPSPAPASPAPASPVPSSPAPASPSPSLAPAAAAVTATSPPPPNNYPPPSTYWVSAPNGPTPDPPGFDPKQRPWKTGRATFYGAPDTFSNAFEKYRGEGAFGILAYGSCGFTNSDGSLPFPIDGVAAAADTNPDFPGSCGRCYAVRCKEGLVLDNDGTPVNMTAGFYMPGADPTLKDTSGRSWPGNPAEPQGKLFTKCVDKETQVVVRVVDTCPCTQVLPDGAPGVKEGGEVRTQEACCSGKAGIAHFDLAYWAFEKLAHPLYGRMMLEYRPVDCDTKVPVPYAPGYISRTDIYNNGTKAGWNWFPYFASSATYAVPGAAPDGASAATCVDLAENGGLSFHVKEGSLPGYQPFKDATAVKFWLRPNSNSNDLSVTSTPMDKPVDLKVFVLNYEKKAYCNAGAIRTASYVVPGSKKGGWVQYSIPLKDFRCDYEGAFPSQVNRIDFQNTNMRHAVFCLAGLKLVK